VKRVLAAIAVLVVAALLGGCANRNAATQKFYTPADGVNAQADNIAIRNVVVVSDGGGTASLLATFVRQQGEDDRLVGVQIDGRAATLTPSEIELPLGTAVTVGVGELSAEVTGADVEPGGIAEVEFRFQRAPRTSVEAFVFPPDYVYLDGERPATATPAATPAG
jgi:1-aminocyclopropane-1-carboxylate deaminase/D-cysteine desulfhydrase-like pyridoxal-dependent ACC family enzyme